MTVKEYSKKHKGKMLVVLTMNEDNVDFTYLSKNTTKDILRLEVMEEIEEDDAVELWCM